MVDEYACMSDCPPLTRRRYKAIGVPGYTAGDLAERRDVSYVQRKLAKQAMQVQVKANKLQKHYREELLQ
jgi:hypothetical protein